MNESIRKPNFFIVGAPKCGTTSLNYYLQQHPDIFMSNYNEPHYFGKDLNKLNNVHITEKNKYLNLFLTVKDEMVIGEKSPYYLFSSLAPLEIYKFNPKAKIVIMLRHPTHMIHSMHSQYYYSGNENERIFSKALRLEKERMKGKYIPKNIDLIEKLLYKTYVYKLPSQIKNYLDIFKKENVKFILLDELKNNVDETYKKLLQFLEVNSSFTPKYNIVNPYKTFRLKIIRDFIKKYSPYFGDLRSKFMNKPLGIMKFVEKINVRYIEQSLIDSRTKEKLDEEFFPIIKELEEIINKDLSHWYN
jgi:hypothetical protein